MPQPELTDTGESNAVGGSGAQDPRWERFYFILLCCVEKDAPELGDTTRHVFLALFWECAIDSTMTDLPVLGEGQRVVTATGHLHHLASDVLVDGRGLDALVG